MIVSWNWLSDYVNLEMARSELEERLSMSGLNHEETIEYADDTAIDLEVTSNRPDWLGHLGIAREIAVLWHEPLQMPEADPPASGPSVDTLGGLRIECPDLCPRYTGRIIRGVRVGPSPDWLVERLQTVGVASVNNLVDITNYVMLECGQPLHAFDLDQLRGSRIVVREARDGEEFAAIDHNVYKLAPGMCVIADAERAVALGGVMGGVDSEISAATTNVLIEAAEFDPLSIRNTARALRLHSPSSYRFERSVDPVGVDWASRRCCRLILELAGGELADGVLDEGQQPTDAPEITLRLTELPRVLGIEVPEDDVRRILTELGCRPEQSPPGRVVVRPPSWRRDLTREIDLIEEVARIYGYDRIPEDASVAMAASHRRPEDLVMDQLRRAMTAAGFDEAMTTSVVDAKQSQAFTPWTDEPPLRTSMPLLKGADHLRRSLVPSLLESRRWNESRAHEEIELFETARIYLQEPDGSSHERRVLGLTSGRGFFDVKGVLECLLRALKNERVLRVEPRELPTLDGQRSVALFLDDELLGFLGELSAAGREQYGLRGPTTIAEWDLDVLARGACLVPQYGSLSTYPATSRDLNLIVEESVRWDALASTVREAAGPLLEELAFREVYRDTERDGQGRKRLLLSLQLRADDHTLSSEEADKVAQRVVGACGERHDARLLG